MERREGNGGCDVMWTRVGEEMDGWLRRGWEEERGWKGDMGYG
jgi:hypothetical protein